MPDRAGLLVNIDVPDLARGIAFYRDAFGLTVTRLIGAGAAELIGWPSPVYLLENTEGSTPALGALRRYARHWTPVHLDVVVPDVDAALARALAAGALLERPPATHPWGRIAGCADPFGHGFCLLTFSERGYEAVAGVTVTGSNHQEAGHAGVTSSLPGHRTKACLSRLPAQGSRLNSIRMPRRYSTSTFPGRRTS